MSDLGLWRAVISQAFADACPANKRSTCKSTLRLIARDYRDARAWLTEMSRDFVLVCQLADLEPDHVSRLARQKMEQFDAAHPELAGRLKASLSFGRDDTCIEHDGKTMTISQWADHVGMKKEKLRQRLKAGIPIAEALSSKRLKARPGAGKQLQTL